MSKHGLLARSALGFSMMLAAGPLAASNVSTIGPRTVGLIVGTQF